MTFPFAFSFPFQVKCHITEPGNLSIGSLFHSVKVICSYYYYFFFWNDSQGCHFPFSLGQPQDRLLGPLLLEACAVKLRD